MAMSSQRDTSLERWVFSANQFKGGFPRLPDRELREGERSVAAELAQEDKPVRPVVRKLPTKSPKGGGNEVGRPSWNELLSFEDTDRDLVGIRSDSRKDDSRFPFEDLINDTVDQMMKEVLLFPYRRQLRSSINREIELSSELMDFSLMCGDERASEIYSEQRSMMSLFARRRNYYQEKIKESLSQAPEGPSTTFSSAFRFERLLRGLEAEFRQEYDGLCRELVSINSNCQRVMDEHDMLVKSLNGMLFDEIVSYLEIDLTPDLEARGGSFSGCLENKGSLLGQYGQLHSLVADIKETDGVIGWCTLPQRDLKYEKLISQNVLIVRRFCRRGLPIPEELCDLVLDFLPFDFVRPSDCDARILSELSPAGYVKLDDGTYLYPVFGPATSHRLDKLYSLGKSLDKSIMIKCRTFAIAEPMKVRTVTIAEALPYWYASLLQPYLWGTVSRHPTFKLTSTPISVERITRQLGKGSLGLDSSWYLSGDYAGATNNLKAWLVDKILDKWSSLAGWSEDMYKTVYQGLHLHHIQSWLDSSFSEGADPDISADQQRGQLMGSPVSFPFLCLANAVVCFTAAKLSKEDWKDFHSAPFLINGDDVSARVGEDYFKSWESIAGECGLVSSVGKTYFSQQFVIMNSTSYRCTSGTFELIPLLRWNLLRPYSPDVKVSDLLGDNRPQSGFGDQARCFCASLLGQEYDSDFELWDIHQDAEWVKEYYRIHRPMIDRLPVSRWLPPSWFGLGLPLYIAEVIYDDPYKHGMRVLIPNRDLRVGRWMRDHYNGGSNVRRTPTALPPLPTPGEKVKPVEYHAPPLTLQSAYTMLLDQHEVEKQVVVRWKLDKTLASARAGKLWHNSIRSYKSHIEVSFDQDKDNVSLYAPGDGVTSRESFCRRLCNFPDSMYIDRSVYLNRIRLDR
jgi:hypothetical protein